jgi:hypothetical protein
MNLEDEVKDPNDFRLIEAVGTGTRFATFEDVFGDPDAVLLLKPKSMTTDEWTGLLDAGKTYLGRPYDTLFDLKNDKALSCVELVRDILKAVPDYYLDFACFEDMLKAYTNLTPDMFAMCPDFEPVYKVAR